MGTCARAHKEGEYGLWENVGSCQNRGCDGGIIPSASPRQTGRRALSQSRRSFLVQDVHVQLARRPPVLHGGFRLGLHLLRQQDKGKVPAGARGPRDARPGLRGADVQSTCRAAPPGWPCDRGASWPASVCPEPSRATRPPTAWCGQHRYPQHGPGVLRPASCSREGPLPPPSNVNAWKTRMGCLTYNPEHFAETPQGLLAGLGRCQPHRGPAAWRLERQRGPLAGTFTTKKVSVPHPAPRPQRGRGLPDGGTAPAGRAPCGAGQWAESAPGRAHRGAIERRLGSGTRGALLRFCSLPGGLLHASWTRAAREPRLQTSFPSTFSPTNGTVLHTAGE